MDPVTTGIGVGLGVANIGINAARNSKIKSAEKKAFALDKDMALQNRKRALEELQVKENQLQHQDVRDVRDINEGMNARDILDSSITTDTQDERQYNLDQKIEAINRQRGDIDYEFQMMQKRQQIGKKLADATNWMSMLQTAINGGAMALSANIGK